MGKKLFKFSTVPSNLNQLLEISSVTLNSKNNNQSLCRQVIPTYLFTSDWALLIIKHYLYIFICSCFLFPLNSNKSNSIKMFKKGLTNSKDKKSKKKRSLESKSRFIITRTLGSSLQVRTEQKATKVLGLIFFLFIICWSPFFTRNIIERLVPSLTMPASLPSIFQWLGFFSSTINPIIYTVFNRNFRRAFRRILFFQEFKNKIERRQLNINNRFNRKCLNNHNWKITNMEKHYSDWLLST